ncbi:MAG TPA: hypothetical protein VGE08_23205 [Steroidobacter sp.]|uniref:hypothetical protein n=1 Tax=Steroidobacter sp. TaxID=1978227 RepID=UPI002ED7A5AF
MKRNQLRADIQAGIASGDAGTLDVEEIKRRGRHSHGETYLARVRKTVLPRLASKTMREQSSNAELFGGETRLGPEPDDGLTARWNLHASAVGESPREVGSGGVMWAVPAVPQSVRLK